MRRYLVAQPENLKSLSITKLAEWISLEGEKLMPCFYKVRQLDPNQAENLLSLRIDTIRRHLEHELVGRFHNKLAIKLTEELIKFVQRLICIKTNKTSQACLRISKTKRHVIIRMIETIFTNKLTSLVFQDKVFDMFHESVISKSHLLSGLTSLEFRITKYTKSENEIISLLKNLPNLRYLTICNVCTNNILHCIAMHCKFIEVLRIPLLSICSPFPDIDDFSIKIICQMSTLTYIDIRNNLKVTKNGVSDLLLTLPKLEHISMTYDEFIYAAIVQIASNRLHVGKHFRLKSYVDRRIKYWGEINLLVGLCPRIEQIVFKRSGCHRLLHLRPIRELQYLQSLELWGYDFYSDRVKALIEARGSNLTHICLKSCKELDLNALIYICQSCPNLERFYIHFSTFIPYSTENYEIKTKTTVTLACLQKLSIESDCENSAPSNEHLYFLLSNCPRVAVIDFCGFAYDPVMIDVLHKCPSNLAHLEVLITHKNIDKFLIDRIVRNCVKPPKVVEYTP